MGANDVAAEPRPWRNTVVGRSPLPGASYVWSGPAAVLTERLTTPRLRSARRPKRSANGKRTGLTCAIYTTSSLLTRDPSSPDRLERLRFIRSLIRGLFGASIRGLGVGARGADQIALAW
jgi:hypothetical protein